MKPSRKEHRSRATRPELETAPESLPGVPPWAQFFEPCPGPEGPVIEFTTRPLCPGRLHAVRSGSPPRPVPRSLPCDWIPTAEQPACFTDLTYCQMWNDLGEAIDWGGDDSRVEVLSESRATDTEDVLSGLRFFVVVSLQPGQGVELHHAAGADGRTRLWVDSELAAALLRVGDFLGLGLDPSSGVVPEEQDLIIVPPHRMTALWSKLRGDQRE